MIPDSALRLIDVLEEAGHATRMVGGAVRDALLGRTVKDIDLATTATPQQVMDVLQAANIKVAPTGLQHGTVTAILDHKGYEITTLRADVKTDGRHAEVAFTDNWAVDAMRRDFTINALYRDRDGKIYDYVDGLEDIHARRVRFVGAPATRITEDYLRILRFFRFQASVARELPDAATLIALEEYAPQLKTLSRERVWAELKKLLAAADPSEAWMLMMQHRILPHLFPEADRLATLCSLISYEHMRSAQRVNEEDAAKKNPPAPNPLVRLAALLAGKKITAEEIQARFALSTEEARKLGLYLANPLVFHGQFDLQSLSFCLYRYGFDLTEEFMLLAQASAAAFHWESARLVLEKWVPKSYPLKGEDILALGLVPGPRVGEILNAVESWWMAQNFAPDRAACLAEAKKRIEQKT